jgi:transketolase
VAETLGEHRPTPVRRIGFEDLYTESAPNEVLLDLYGISAQRVAERVRGIRWDG